MDSTQYHDEELRQLFRQLPDEKPSAGFSSQVMAQVMIEAKHIADRKRMLRTVWSISIPGFAIFLAIAGFFTRDYWQTAILGYFKPLYISLNHAFSSISGLFTDNYGSKTIILGLSVLALLLTDLFLRRHADRKHQLSN